MQDLHNPCKDNVFWPRERIGWDRHRIADWSGWISAHSKKQAVMALDDGTRHGIHEEGSIL
jgi:hypothetical protein